MNLKSVGAVGFFCTMLFLGCCINASDYYSDETKEQKQLSKEESLAKVTAIMIGSGAFFGLGATIFGTYAFNISKRKFTTQKTYPLHKNVIRNAGIGAV